MRPSSKNSTASSKSLNLAKGPSRAASVVPLLSLDTSSNESLSPKRPYSADNLPSSELLKQMLSEPIRSWRNYYTNNNTQEEAVIEATSLISLASGCCGEKAKEFELLPGLVEKPPLPKAAGDATNKTDTEKIEKSPPRDVLFQNWISEEKEIESDILLSERRTDQFLDDLKHNETAAMDDEGLTKAETWVCKANFLLNTVLCAFFEISFIT